MKINIFEVGKMNESDKPLSSELFLKEMVLLFKNRSAFVKIINGYFAGHKDNWKDGDRADRIISTLRNGEFEK